MKFEGATKTALKFCRFDTSAKTNHNVDKSVRALIRNILGHKDAFEAQKKAAESAADEARVALGAKEQKGSCC